ncbi:Cro/Cl family transcriptional regulator [Kushneria pakistanensis]|uniref:Cro/Cl family transcriptional regulator n=1 Tax=Kushneria pakistanensis TaxID=1508770 RepID=A0ABQ3F8T8_9GAMM|nr:RodZ family helix-turn-helix domain-containing protein [Kushneria pakistanensis]GHC14376.1 Cro/Cl family transcriptional regulator [Kushneria pakistanensis]
MSEQHASSAVEPGAGEMLREERERQRLPLEDAAEQLNLRPSLVADMERDNYEQIPIPTYRRGYLRAYARLLGIDDRAIVAAYDRVHGRSDLDERRVAPISSIKPPSRMGAIAFRVASVAVVVILAVMTLLWWEGRESAPGYGDDSAMPEQNVVQQEAAADRDLPPAPEAQPGTTPTATDGSGNMAGSTPVNSSIATQVAGGETTSDIPRPGTLQVDTPEGRNGATGGLVDTSSDEDSAADPAASGRNVQMSFGSESWVDVRDANGTTVLRGLQQSGTTATIEGVPPFRLTVGNANQVTIDYRGERVDMSQHAGSSNVARFTLGE